MRAEVAKAVELLQSGEAGRVEEALRLLQNTVYSFSMNVCGHREDAEDTMQDVLLKAIPYLPQFDSAKALTTWLYTVAKNRCLMSRRRSKFAPKEHLSLDELMPDAAELDRLSALATDEPSPEMAAMTNQSSDQLKALIRQLPPPYRLILVLHDVEDLSTDEIAKITHLREGTVRVRLHRARLFLRRELGKTASRMPPTRSRKLARHSVPRPAPEAKCKQMFAALSDYLDGMLDPSLCEQLQSHMAGCAPCEAFLSDLRATVEQLKGVGGTSPNPEIATRIRRELLPQLEKALAAAK